MSANQTVATAGTASPPPPTDIAKIDIADRAIEYVPFLSEQQISLTPRMVIRFMCKPTRSGKRATVEQAVHFCMLCQARGLNPWEGDAYIVGYDTQDGPEFSLITAHQAFLKRAEVHPEYDGMRSGVILKRGDDVVEEEGDFFLETDTLLGGWAKVLLKNRETPVYKRLRLATFNKGFGRWKIDPAGMIVKCAESDALRSAFPNSLGGMYLEDEMPGKEDPPKTENGNGKSKSQRLAEQLSQHGAEPEQSQTTEAVAAEVCVKCGATDLDAALTETPEGFVCPACAPPKINPNKVSLDTLTLIQDECVRIGSRMSVETQQRLKCAPEEMDPSDAQALLEELKGRPDKKSKK